MRSAAGTVVLGVLLGVGRLWAQSDEDRQGISAKTFDQVFSLVKA